MCGSADSKSIRSGARDLCLAPFVTAPSLPPPLFAQRHPALLSRLPSDRPYVSICPHFGWCRIHRFTRAASGVEQLINPMMADVGLEGASLKVLCFERGSGFRCGSLVPVVVEGHLTHHPSVGLGSTSEPSVLGVSTNREALFTGVLFCNYQSRDVEPKPSHSTPPYLRAMAESTRTWGENMYTKRAYWLPRPMLVPEVGCEGQRRKRPGLSPISS